MERTFWLKFSNIQYMQFEIQNQGIWVKGPLGLSDSINESMTVDNARKYWKELVGVGYHRIPTSEAPGYHYFEALMYGN